MLESDEDEDRIITGVSQESVRTPARNRGGGRFLGGGYFIATPFTDEEMRCDERMNEDDRFLFHINLKYDSSGKSLKLFMASRTACSMRFFGAFKFWDCLDRNVLDQNRFVETLKCFNNRLNRFDADLANSLASGRTTDRKLAKSAFNSEHSSQGKGTSPSFHHGILQLAVFDRMASTLLDPNEYEAFHRSPLISAKTITPSRVKGLVAISADWVSHMKSFSDSVANLEGEPRLSASISQETTQSRSQQHTSEEEAQCRLAIASLASCADRSKKDALYSVAKFNFCMASLGYIGLTLPETTQDSKETIVSRLLRVISEDRETTRLLEKYKDYDLLKAIYFATAFSPVSLLIGQRMNLNNSAYRIPLPYLAQSLELDIYFYSVQRLRMETRLFSIIRDMAMNGCEVFDALIHDLCQERMWEWEEEEIEQITEKPPIPERGLFAFTRDFLANIAHSTGLKSTDRAEPKRIIASKIMEVESDIREKDIRYGTDLEKDVEDNPGSDDQSQNSNEGGRKRSRTMSGDSEGAVPREEQAEEQATPSDGRDQQEYKYIILGERPTKRLSLVLESEARSDNSETLQVPAFKLSLERNKLAWKIGSSKIRLWGSSPFLGLQYILRKQCYPRKIVRLVVGLDWDKLPHAERRKMAVDGPVLIRREAVADGTRLGIRDWRSDGWHALLDMNEKRIVKNYSDERNRYVQASVAELIKETEKQSKRALCCGYIPITSSAVSLGIQDLDDLSGMLNSGRSDHSVWETVTQPDVLGGKWAHVTTGSTAIDYHLGPSGLGTLLQPIINPIVVCIPNTMMWPRKDGGEGYAPDPDVEWAVIQVDQGCELIIPPEYGYALINCQDSLLLGAHFYCTDSVCQSLLTITIQHYYRFQPEIPFREQAPLLLFKLLDKLIDNLAEGKSIKELPARFPRDPTAIASLVLLVGHIDQLAPRGCSQPWQASPEFQRDHTYAKKLIRKLLYDRWNSSLTNQLIEMDKMYRNVIQCLNDHFASEPETHVRFVRCHELAAEVGL